MTISHFYARNDPFSSNTSHRNITAHLLRDHITGFIALLGQVTIDIGRLLLEPEGCRLAALNMDAEALANLEASAMDMAHGGAPARWSSRRARRA